MEIKKEKTPKKRYLLIEIETRDGEREYTTQGVHELKPRANIDKFADEYAKDFWGERGRKYEAGSEWYEFDGGCITSRVKRCEEIPFEHYQVLKQYL